MKDEESNKGGQDGRYAQMVDECEDKIKDRSTTARWARERADGWNWM